MEVSVVNNEDEQRFETQLGSAAAFLAYRRSPGKLVLLHTEVPPAYRGNGIAGQLVSAAVRFARQSHLRIVPLCPFTSAFLAKHPEYQDVTSDNPL